VNERCPEMNARRSEQLVMHWVVVPTPSGGSRLEAVWSAPSPVVGSQAA
jgi:hypothetical protein